MKSNTKITLLLSLAAICFTAGSLGAATIEGSFTLPGQTQWGLAVLPAGHYTFTLDHASTRGMIMVRRGNDGVGMIVNPGSSLTSTAGGSSMLIVRNRVRSLHLAPLGMTFDYPTHNQKKEVLARSSGVAATVVSVDAK
jgi:hypothetical protein